MFPTIAILAAGFWGSVLYLGLRFVRSAEHRGISRRELEELSGRVAQLEEDLATAHGEINRLTASERFTAQLLAGRTAPVPPAT